MLPPLNEIPCLIESCSHQLPSSSCCSQHEQQQHQHQQQQELVIRPVLAQGHITFDWSDFPIVQRDAFFFAPLMEQKHNDASSSSSCCQPQTQQQQEQQPELMSACSSDSDMMSTSSSVSVSSVMSNKPARRNVSFAPTKHVRTHSLVLGDHPCCAQLALELGWDHEDGFECMMMEQQEQSSSSSTSSSRRRRQEPRRRSYFERKALLKEVGGMTEEEIRMTTLRHSAPSSRELSVMQGRGISI